MASSLVDVAVLADSGVVLMVALTGCAVVPPMGLLVELAFAGVRVVLVVCAVLPLIAIGDTVVLLEIVVPVTGNERENEIALRKHDQTIYQTRHSQTF